MTDDPINHADAQIHDAIEEVFLAIQREYGLTWAEAAHRLIVYGVDALHLNPGVDGTVGELIEARATVEDALAELTGARH